MKNQKPLPSKNQFPSPAKESRRTKNKSPIKKRLIRTEKSKMIL